MHQEVLGKERDSQYQNLLNLIGGRPQQTEDSKPSLKATQMRSIINSHRMNEAYKKTSRVAYVSEQFPTEIVFAFDMIPWNVESMAIMLAQSLDVDRIFKLTQEHELSRDICSFLRGPYGMMMENCYPTPNVVLTNTQPCEGLSKLGVISGKGYKAPIRALHAPNDVDEDSLNYLVKQMEKMMSQLADDLDIDPDPDALKSVVEYSNQARSYYNKTVALLKDNSIPVISRELQEIFGMNYFGVKENAQICKVLYEEALLQSKDANNRRKRVLWIGQVPEESHEILEHMREVVDIIYWAPLWDANMMMLDENDPLRSIAERAILYHWDAERTRGETSKICDDHQIDGFLIANVWGCRNVMGISQVLRDIATDKGLKHLTINVDLVDRNNYAYNNIKNRVDAFLELLQ